MLTKWFQVSKGNAPRFRPQLETLENRWVPSHLGASQLANSEPAFQLTDPAANEIVKQLNGPSKLHGEESVVTVDSENLFAAGRTVLPPPTNSQERLRLRAEGTLDINDDGVGVMELSGTASHLGKLQGFGELALLPGQEEGSLEGFGVVAFTAQNGDSLAGEMSWSSDAEGAVLSEFHWRDEVTFSDGTVATSTGRFDHHRPPGLTFKFQVIDSETGEVVFEITIRF